MPRIAIMEFPDGEFEGPGPPASASLTVSFQATLAERHVPSDFTQIRWDPQLADDCRHIVRLAIREDLDRFHDWTTQALIDPAARAAGEMVARQPLVVAGLVALDVLLDESEVELDVERRAADGQSVSAGTTLARLSGPARHLLTTERIMLNLVSRLSGIATLTSRYVARLAGTQARIYDTRKTTPGWRRLEKYAVRCGGGRNHRCGLFDAILIKDNHLSFSNLDPADAVLAARALLRRFDDSSACRGMIVEVEVDTLAQLEQVLPVGPDIVLLDNMTLDELRRAVELRTKLAPAVQLEASGGVHLETVAEVAGSGVDRISVGALTHAAAWVDIGLDWSSKP